MSAIQEHQQFSDNRNNINVCMHHFQKEMININQNGLKKLAIDAVPSIFGTQQIIQQITPPVQSSFCSNCSKLEKKVADLEAQLRKSQIDHDMALQSLTVKLNNLAKAKADMAAEFAKVKKKFREQEKKLEKLSHEDRGYFTSNNGEIPNVSRC